MPKFSCHLNQCFSKSDRASCALSWRWEWPHGHFMHPKVVPLTGGGESCVFPVATSTWTAVKSYGLLLQITWNRQPGYWYWKDNST